jgi:accessory gene regulator protein AgrB
MFVPTILTAAPATGLCVSASVTRPLITAAFEIEEKKIRKKKNKLVVMYLIRLSIYLILDKSIPKKIRLGYNYMTLLITINL